MLALWSGAHFLALFYTDGDHHFFNSSLPAIGVMTLAYALIFLAASFKSGKAAQAICLLGMVGMCFFRDGKLKNEPYELAHTINFMQLFMASGQVE